MSTEYRRGIPSTAHVEAATRLGLLWGDNYSLDRRWYFEIRDGVFHSDFESPGASLGELRSGLGFWMPPAWVDLRPIHPDGTPVDWEVLDQEVARAGQQGQPLIGRDADGSQFAINTDGSRSPLPTHPQGFRADLWRRLVHNLFGDPDYEPAEDSFEYLIRPNGELVDLRWNDGPNTPSRADILAGWTVYQELKPLYDLVDGAQGEAAMPRDVYNECRARAGWTGEADDRWLLRYNSRLEAVGIGEVWHGDGRTLFERANMRNFAAVLDAVAERRVAERMRRQTQAPTVTSAQPEPRRFADVRPDRHGWRWWRDLTTDNCFTIRDGVYVRRFDVIDPWLVLDLSAWLDRTVIPTDEQGNPVSWESIEQERSAGQTAPTVTGRTATLIYVDDITTQAPSAQELRTAWDSINKTLPLPTQPPLLPRFTADELDDVDHSKTTKLDEVTLRRGKLPTVEQIAKYREVRAKRLGGTVADALKESRIDCEVAQYVLERWAGGLGDELALWLLRAVGKYSRSELRFTQRSVDELAQCELTHEAGAIETAESSPTMQRERQEAEERRQRLAELRQRLAAERAAQPQEMAKEDAAASRFDLIEPDPQADPAASIRAWEARQAAVKVRPVAIPAKPAAAPRRPAIEVVDAEADGLSRVEIVTALFGRALNGGC